MNNHTTLQRVKLPFPIRAWNSAGRLTGQLGLGKPLSAQGLMTAAQKAEGLYNFGDQDFKTPLNHLIESINQESNLHPFGKFVTRQRLTGLLRNRLRAEYYFKKYPEILDIELEAPIVIAGLQRTGTTFLQRLLASHPEIRSLKSWEALNPAPHLGWESGKADLRIREGKKAEKGLRYLNPSFFAIHPVEYNSPEEEVLLLDISFLSTVAEATLHVPSFADWLENQDHTPAYEYMKKLLKLLSWQNPGKRWVLKTPHHLEYLDILTKVFPGSTIIQTHRNPIVTVPSLCSMLWHGRFIFSDEVDPQQIGRQWLRKVERMMVRSSEFRRSGYEGQIIDIQYQDLIDDPIKQIERIFEIAGEGFDSEALKKAQELLNNQRKDRYGVHRYRPEDFGLSEASIKDRLAPFMIKNG